MISITRKKGLKKFGLGIFIGITLLSSIYWLLLQGTPINSLIFISLGAPILWIIDGGFQLIMNQSLFVSKPCKQAEIRSLA